MSDFGTRRRHGFLWHRWCVEAMQEGLGASFIGTSNVKHAMDTGLEAIGTNAHELPMVYAALAEDDEELLEAPYKVLKDWAKMYGGNLLVVLPDCFGTTSFLNNAPDWVADWKGARPDSKPPIAAARELIEWWKERGRDPREKLVVLSDAMDIDSIEESVRALRGQVNLSFGWGTNLTNDFVGCAPAGVDGQLKAISFVCKVVEADGRPAVKLSDNPNKVDGPAGGGRALPAPVSERAAWCASLSKLTSIRSERGSKAMPFEGFWSGRAAVLQGARIPPEPRNGSRKTGSDVREGRKGADGRACGRDDGASHAGQNSDQGRPEVVAVPHPSRRALFQAQGPVQDECRRRDDADQAPRTIPACFISRHLSPKECFFFAAGFHMPIPAAREAPRGGGPGFPRSSNRLTAKPARPRSSRFGTRRPSSGRARTREASDPDDRYATRLKH